MIRCITLYTIIFNLQLNVLLYSRRFLKNKYIFGNKIINLYIKLLDIIIYDT